MIGDDSVMLAAPFIGDEIEFLHLDASLRHFEFPKVFVNVARIGTLFQVRTGERTLGGTLRSDRLRRSLYRAGVLAAIAGTDLERLHPDAAASGQAPRHLDMAGAVLSATSRATGTARTLESVLSAADPAFQNPSLSAVARDAGGLGLLSLGYGIVTGFADEQARNQLLAEAAADAELVAALGAMAAMLAAQPRHDPAMVAGIRDAIRDIERLSNQRLNRIARAGVQVLRDNQYKLGAMVIASYFGPMGALVVREVAEAQEILDGFTERALVVAAQQTLAAQTQPLIFQLIADGAAPGGLRAADAPVIGLAWLHTRLRAEATAATHAMLWIEPRENPFSAFAIGRALSLTVNEALTAPGDLRGAYERELARRAGDHLVTHGLTLAALVPTADTVAVSPEGARNHDFAGFRVSLPETFVTIAENDSQLVLAPHDPESGAFEINARDGGKPVVAFIGSTGRGADAMNRNRDQMARLGYQITAATPDAAPMFEAFELILPEGLAPRGDGRPGIERALSFLSDGEGGDAVAFLLIGYHLDAAKRAEYDAARDILLRSLRPIEAVQDAAEATTPAPEAEAATPTPRRPAVPPAPDRVEPCRDFNDRPGLTIPLEGSCVSESTSGVLFSGSHVRNLDFLQDFARAGMALDTLHFFQPDNLENIAGIRRSRIRNFGLRQMPLDADFLAPLRQHSLRVLDLRPLPEPGTQVIPMAALNAIGLQSELALTVPADTTLDMSGYAPQGIPHLRVTGADRARVDFGGLVRGRSRIETLMLDGLASDLSGLNTLAGLARLELVATAGADYRLVAALPDLRELRVVGLEGVHVAALNRASQLERFRLVAFAPDGTATRAEVDAALAQFDPACLSGWPALNTLYLSIPGLEVDLSDRDSVVAWLAAQGAPPDPSLCGAGAQAPAGLVPPVAGTAGGAAIDAAIVRTVPGAPQDAPVAELRSYPLPELNRIRYAQDTTPEAGLTLLRGRPHGAEGEMAIYDYRSGTFLAKDVPAADMRSNHIFRGEEVPRIIDGGSDLNRARISPDGRFLAASLKRRDGAVLRLFDLADGGREVANVGHPGDFIMDIAYLAWDETALELLVSSNEGFSQITLQGDGEPGSRNWTSRVDHRDEGFVSGPTIFQQVRPLGGGGLWGASAIMEQSRMLPTGGQAVVSAVTMLRPGEFSAETMALPQSFRPRDQVWLPRIEALAVVSDRQFALVLPQHHDARNRGLGSELADLPQMFPDLHYLPGRDVLILSSPDRIIAFAPERLMDWLAQPNADILDFGVDLLQGQAHLPELGGRHGMITVPGQEHLVVLPLARSRQSRNWSTVMELPLADLLDHYGLPVAGRASGSVSRAPAGDGGAVPGAETLRMPDPVPAGGADGGVSGEVSLAQAPVEPVMVPASAPSLADAAPQAATAPPPPLSAAPPPADAAPQASSAADLAEALQRVARLEREVEQALDMSVEADLARRRAEGALDRVMRDLAASAEALDAARAAQAEAEEIAVIEATAAEALRHRLENSEQAALADKAIAEEALNRERARVQELSDRARDLIDRIEALQSAPPDAEAQIATLSAQLNMALAQVASEQRARADAERAASEAAARIAALERRIAQLEATNAILRQDLAAASPGSPTRDTTDPDGAVAAPFAETRSVRLSPAPITMPANLDQMARNLFGPDFELANWEDIKARYEREGGAFLRAAGLVREDERGPNKAAVKAEGSHLRPGTRNRFHFINWGRLPQGARAIAAARHADGVLVLSASPDAQHLLAMRAAMPDPGRMVMAEQLNVRAGPGTDFDAVDRLLLGTDVAVAEVVNSWARIGPERWVAEQFLSQRNTVASLIGNGQVESGRGSLPMQLRMIAEDGAITRAILLILREGGDVDVVGLRDIARLSPTEIFLRSAPTIGDFELRLTGDCIVAVETTATGEQQDCALAGTLRNGQNTFRFTAR